MARSKRPGVQKYHDRVAHRYDDSYDDAYWQWHDSLTWDYLKPFLPRDLRAPILDLGCGTGKWAIKIMQSGYSVVCVDISAKMVDETRRKVEELKLSARAGFLQADLCDLSALPERGAALAVAMGDPIGCTSSPPQALKQIRWALAPDGVLVATFDNRFAAIDHYLSQGDPAVLAEFLRHGRTNWLTKEAEERFEIHTYGPTELVRLLEAAGFQILELLGKTVLPMRQHREMLAESEARRTWAKIEKSLCRDPGALPRASHFQVACRVRNG